MTVENLPRWSILPNWRTQVTERLSWLTTVLRSQTGAEQRFSLRVGPRRSFEALMTPVGPSRTLFDLSVGAVGVDPWYIPVWHDVSTLDATLASGATSLTIDTVNREFAVGGFIFLHNGEFETAVLEITSKTDTTLGFTTGPTQDWPVGTRVHPAVKARLVEQPSMSRIANRAMENAVRFEVVGANDWSGASVTPPTYLTFPVLTLQPNVSTNLSMAYERLFAEHDDLIGVMERTHLSTLSLTAQQHTWLAVGRQEHAELRSFFFSLEGKREALWVPTFADDFILAAGITSGDASLTVERCGFTDYGGPREGREHVEILLRDGTAFRRQITGSTNAVNGLTENIVLSAAIAQTITLPEIKRTSFLTLSRLDVDDIELVHETDSQGVVRASAIFRSAPDLRSGADWTTPALPSTVQTAGECGVCVPGIFLSGSTFLIEAGDPDGNAPNTQVASIAPGTAAGFAITYQNDTDATTGLRYPRFVSISGNDVVGTAQELEDTSTATDYFFGSDLTLLGDGNYAAVLAQVRPAFTGAVVSRTLNASSGIVSSAQIRAPVTNQTFTINPSVVPGSASGGDYYVLTTTNRNATGPTPSIFVEKRNSDHTSAIAEVTLDSGTSPAPTAGRLFRFSNGNLLAVWSKSGVLYYQVLDASLSSVTSAAAITDNAAGTTATAIEIVASPNGALVLWTEYTSFTTQSARHREVEPDGTLSALGTFYTAVAVSGGSGPDRIAMGLDMTASGAVVLLENVTTYSAGDYSTQIRATLYESDRATVVGSVDIGPPRVLSYNPFMQGTSGQVVRLDDGTFAAALVLFNSSPTGEDDVSIFGQRLTVEECL